MNTADKAIRDDRGIVTASDIGAFAYDPETWMREQRTGPSPAASAAMREGTIHHERIRRDAFPARQRAARPAPASRWPVVFFVIAVAIASLLGFRFGIGDLR